MEDRFHLTSQVSLKFSEYLLNEAIKKIECFFKDVCIPKIIRLKLKLKSTKTF